MYRNELLKKVKNKGIPVTGHGGPWGCEMLMFPHFLDNRLIDGVKIVSPTHRPPFTPKNFPRILLVLISVRGWSHGHSVAGRIRSIEINPEFDDWVYWHFFTITVDCKSSHIELLLNDVYLTSLSEESLTNLWLVWITLIHEWAPCHELIMSNSLLSSVVTWMSLLIFIPTETGANEPLLSNG
jgi:hypothetical protein